MGELNFEAWEVDIQSGTATHETGLTIKFEGRPGKNFNGSPRNWPKELTALEKVRLIRYGYEAYRKALEGD